MMPLWFWALLAVGLALPLGIGYVVARRTVGAKIARERMLILLLILIVTAPLGVALFYAPNAWRDNGFALFGFAYLAFVLCYALFLRQQRRKAGTVLLDLGYATTSRRFLMIIFLIFIVLAMMLAIASFIDEGLTVENAGRFAFNVGICGFNLILATIRNQICEHGLLIGGALLRWGKLRGYEWQQDRPNALRVDGPRRWAFFGGTALPVPPQHRERVAKLLEQYAGGSQVNSSSTT